ncbi:MAG: DUF4136 domain-containing protein [Steroidobacteraceae bacterium]
MNKNLLAGVAALTMLTACESGPTIRSNVDPSANLSSYKTYMFAAKTGTDRPEYATPITSYFKEAIRREMDARGYKHVEGGPADLLVNFNANARENVDVRTTPGSTYGYGYGYYGYRGGLYGATAFPPEVQTVRYKQGTANVDVVDLSRKQVVWEGIAEARLTDKMMKDPRTAISSVITQMFAQFPGRASGG